MSMIIKLICSKCGGEVEVGDWYMGEGELVVRVEPCGSCSAESSAPLSCAKCGGAVSPFCGNCNDGAQADRDVF